MNKHSTITTYRFRETPCGCDDGKAHGWSAYGPTTDRCDTCEGSGMVTASCCECEAVTELNHEGCCERCVDAGELPIEAFQVKYHPHLMIGRGA